MMRHIVAASLRFRFLLVAMAIGMTVIGLGQIKSMPIDVFPEFSPPYVEIQTLAVGLAPEEVESLISVPMEEVLAGTPELETIRSKSANDLSVIDMYFKRGTNQLDARQLVQERMDQVAPRLPTWAAPPVMLQPLSATSRAMKIGITSDKLNGIQQSMIAYWSIRQRLLQVPGVANVPIWGEKLEMLNVNVDRARMAAQHVSLEEVMTTTSDALDAGLMRFSEGAHIGTGGFVEAGTQRTGIRHKLPIASAEELSQVVVRPGVNGKAPLRIADVADVVTNHQPMIGEAVIGSGPGLMLVVEKLPWANTLDVTRGVEQALDEMKPGLPDLTIDTNIFRPATFIETSLHNLSSALLIGCLLVIVMLFLFLYEWRVALISIVAIPLSLVVATLVLAWRGTTINTMILAGFAIALGDVVDDAIIDIENVVRRLRQHRAAGNPGSTAGVILRASMEVRGAIVYATLIEVVAIVPILFLGGLSGSFFRPMVLSYALALIASMGVALTLTPALALIVVRKAPLLRRRQSPLAKGLQWAYVRVLSRIVRSPKPAFGAMVLILGAGVLLGPGLGQSLMPEFKERDMLMHFINRPGTSLAEEVRVTTESGKLIQAVPGVKTFGAHIGQAFQSDESVGVEMAERWISIDPKADYDKTVKAVEATNDNYPGLIRDVTTYLNERIDEVLEGTSFPIVVRMFGPDNAVLRAKADEVTKAIKDVPGIADLMPELQTEVPQVQVKVDLDKAQAVGLKPGDVRRAASAQIQGEEVGDIFRDGKAYDINVWSPIGKRQNIDDLRNLPLDTPAGKQVRMADVADVSLKSSVNYVRHENNSRKMDVTADVSGRALGSVVQDIKSRLSKVAFPAGYHYELMGAYSERQAANKRIRDVGFFAAIAIFLLLQAAYGSFRLATLTFLTLPMALAGGVAAAWLTTGVVSLGSVAGFLTVIGMVARHGIMLISHFRHLERYEGVPFGPDLVIQGAKERLVPITMTVLATGLALLPLAISGNIPGQEIEYPMAVVILGGLVSATLANLLVVPSLYLAFGKSRAERAGGGQVPVLVAG